MKWSSRLAGFFLALWFVSLFLVPWLPGWWYLTLLAVCLCAVPFVGWLERRKL